MPFLRWIGRGLLTLVLALLGGLWAGFSHVLGQLARWVGMGLACLVALAAAGYALVWVINNRPDIIQQLLLIVALLFGLWLVGWGLWRMVSAPFRRGRQENNQRH